MFLVLSHCFISIDCYCRLLENWRFITVRDTEFHHVIWSFIILSPGAFSHFLCNDVRLEIRHLTAALHDNCGVPGNIHGAHFDLRPFWSLMSNDENTTTVRRNKALDCNSTCVDLHVTTCNLPNQSCHSKLDTKPLNFDCVPFQQKSLLADLIAGAVLESIILWATVT